MFANKIIGCWEKIHIQFGNLQRGIVELVANEVAVDVRKESRVLQDLIQAEKRSEKKKKKAEEGASKKAATTNKRKPSRKENGDATSRKKKTANKKSKAGTI